MKLDWRLADESIAEDCDEEERDPEYRKSVRCKVFLGFTSNLISSGVRDTVRYLVQHHMVSIAYFFMFDELIKEEILIFAELLLFLLHRSHEISIFL